MKKQEKKVVEHQFTQGIEMMIRLLQGEGWEIYKPITVRWSWRQWHYVFRCKMVKSN